jgi:hypothetical protein
MNSNILFRSDMLKMSAAPFSVKCEPSLASAVAQSRRDTYSVHDTAAPLRLALGSMKASSSFAARSRFLPGVFDPHHGPMTMMLTLACFVWLYAHAHSEAQSRNHTHTFSTACIHPSCSSHIAGRSSQHMQRLGFVQTK